MAHRVNEDITLHDGAALRQFVKYNPTIVNAPYSFDEQQTLFGQWAYANSTDLITARFRTFVPPDVAVQLHVKDDDQVAGLVMVTWIPGALDGSRGIGEATIKEHITAIKHRRNVNAPDRTFSPLSANPSYGYCGTDPHWFMRKHADMSHIPNTLGTYSIPTEATIVKYWPGWNSLAGAQVVNPYPASQFYLAASNRDILQGGQYGPTAYDKTRNVGWTGTNNNKIINPDDVTSFHPGQHNWDMTNLPAILYQLYPTTVDQHPENWPKPPQMRDVNGNPMFDPADPTFPILDWTILPFHISTKEDPFVMAAWLRLDPRMSWKDIIARMVPDGRPIPNVLNMRVSRLNASIDIFPWRDSCRSQQKIENEIKKGKRKPLTLFHTLFNTTRGLTPGWNWSEFEKHVPVTELKWIEFKGKLAHLNSTIDSVGWKYKPQVDDETLGKSEIYQIWYQYPASAYVNSTDPGMPPRPTRRGRPTIPSALAPAQPAVVPAQPAVAPAINNSPTKADSRKRRHSLSQDCQPSKKQRNASPSTTSDMINAEAHVGLPALEPDRNSCTDTSEYWHFNEELSPMDTSASAYFPDPSEFEQNANPNLDQRGSESVYADIYDHDLYIEQSLYDAEANISKFGNEAEHCMEQLTQEPAFDDEFAGHKSNISDDHIDWKPIDWNPIDRNPAVHLLELDPKSRTLTEEVIEDAFVLVGYANASNRWTHATQSEEPEEPEEPEEEDARDLTLNEKNFYYIADAHITDWVDTHPDDPKEYMHAVVLQFAQYDYYYMCNGTTKQYSM